MGTPGDEIVRELERLPARDQMNAVVEVMQRLGITSGARPGFLGRRGKIWATAGVAVLALGVGALVAHALMDKPALHGWLDLMTSPDDALVFIDGRQVGEERGTWVHRATGPHALTVTRPGYIPSDQNINLSSSRPLHLYVKLEVAPTTGFEITSEPAGLGVWLDGKPINRPSGPVRTAFRAERIKPGSHYIELVNGGGDLVWRQDVSIEPDQIYKVHAIVPGVSAWGGTRR